MRHVILALAALSISVPAAQAQTPGASADAKQIAAGTYGIDAAHTQVTWKVNHMGFSMLQGQFGAEAGTITVDPADPGATKVDITFRTADLSVTSGAFASHLKSKDFFDVDSHPTARFVSTHVMPASGGATVHGDLTIKGVTRPVELRVQFVGAGANPMSKKLNFGFHATATIMRSEFGLGMAVPAVSDKVELEINAAFTAR